MKTRGGRKEQPDGAQAGHEDHQTARGDHGHRRVAQPVRQDGGEEPATPANVKAGRPDRPGPPSPPSSM